MVAVTAVVEGEVHSTEICRSEKALPANRCSPRRGGTAPAGDSGTASVVVTAPCGCGCKGVNQLLLSDDKALAEVLTVRAASERVEEEREGQEEVGWSKLFGALIVCVCVCVCGVHGRPRRLEDDDKQQESAAPTQHHASSLTMDQLGATFQGQPFQFP